MGFQTLKKTIVTDRQVETVLEDTLLTEISMQSTRRHYYCVIIIQTKPRIGLRTNSFVITHSDGQKLT